MTAVVRKGAGRPAHAANRAKHAQRTPLPARGQRGVAGRGMAAKAIKEEHDAQKATPAAKKSTPRVTKPVEPEVSAAALKSQAKADDAAAVAKRHHYDVEIQAAGGYCKVVAVKTHKDGTREQVEVAFIDGRMSQEDMPRVIIKAPNTVERVVLLRNASAFKMQVSEKPSKPVALHARTQRSRDDDDEEPTGAGFDETATEVVLLDHFRGARLTWRNGLGGNKLEHGAVNPKARRGPNYRITDHPKQKGVRILHFIDQETGQQRAVALNKINRVVK